MTLPRIFVNDIRERNVILSLMDLTNLLLENMICRQCKIVHTMELRAETLGIATKLSLACKNPLCRKCNQWTVMEPSMVKLEKLVDKNCDPYDIKQTGNRGTRKYQLNLDLTLATQMIGGGGADYAIIASQLNLNCTQRQLKDSFTSNEETIGLHIIDMAEKVVEENLKNEKLASELVQDPISVEVHLLADRNRKRKMAENAPPSDPTTLVLGDVILDGEIPTVPTWYACPETTGVEDRRPTKRKLGISMDAGWRKRSSGRRYDSQMGQFFAFGIETNKIIYCQQMSMRCRKCEHNVAHDPKLCSHNYTGSAKGMEPHAAVKCIESIFSQGDAFVGTVVTDDDSTMRSRLKQNGGEKVEAGVCVTEDLPKTIQLNKRSDHGALDLDVPEPVCKADANHRVRAYGNALHKLVDMKNADSGGVTGVDRDRLKQKICYARAKNVDKNFNQFKDAFEPSIEHHFNNHTLCGDWCASKKLTDRGELADHLHYRCKEKNKKMYEKIKDIHAIFTTNEKLREIHHKVNTNLSESANFVVTKFLPKHKHYGTTIVDKSRVSLAVCIISNGYKDTMVNLYTKLGFNVGLLQKKGWSDMDDIRDYNSRYHKLDKVKRNRVLRNTVTKRENRKKEEKQKRKGEHYSGGMGLNEDTTQSVLNIGRRQNKRRNMGNGLTVQGGKKKTECRRCKRTDHFIKCKKCPYHKDYKPPPGTDSATDMVEVAAMKLAYPSGMYMTQVIDVNVVPFVHITVDEEGEF